MEVDPGPATLRPGGAEEQPVGETSMPGTLGVAGGACYPGGAWAGQVGPLCFVKPCFVRRYLHRQTDRQTDRRQTDRQTEETQQQSYSSTQVFCTDTQTQRHTGPRKHTETLR